MTLSQFETLNKYLPKWDTYNKAKTLSLTNQELNELKNLRMDLRRSATNINCQVCVIEMLNDLFRNEYYPHLELIKMANANLDKQLKEVEQPETKQPLKRKRK